MCWWTWQVTAIQTIKDELWLHDPPNMSLFVTHTISVKISWEYTWKTNKHFFTWGTCLEFVPFNISVTLLTTWTCTTSFKQVCRSLLLANTLMSAWSWIWILVHATIKWADWQAVLSTEWLLSVSDVMSLPKFSRVIFWCFDLRQLNYTL